ncbi:MAG: ABC transporter ATP-binding protein [Alphaproteobacteria bacterium]|nr:ABC transporter ATP-binding protein [Alphaproteobacteria bacterium]
MSGPSPSPVIDVHNLSKRYGGKTVVDRLSLTVPRGHIYGFLGPNGSGKTTTIRMLCGLLTPDEGEGTCLGFDLRRDAEKIKRQVGYMTQKFSFWEDMTIHENLSFVARLFELDRPDERVEAIMNSMQLTDRASQLAGSLSGGWKQRLALAACILHEPSLLLLDEPTAGVDPKARRDFWDEIHRLADQGITVLVSTHYMEEAERCHSIVYMAYSRLIVQGTVEEVIAQSHLVTWTVEGSHLMDLMRSLEGNPAIATLAPFGTRLHISGTDEALMMKALAPYMNNETLTWSRTTPTLEDAFIHFMAQHGERGGKAA